MTRLAFLALGTAGCSLMGLYDAEPAEPCPAQTVRCPPDGDCTDLLTDPQACGGCAIECDAREYCNEGSCECRPELTDCDGACVDTTSSPAHCGGCLRPPCGAPQRCSLGECADECDLTTEDCGEGVCANMETDVMHCGVCDRQCAVDQLCIRGACADYAPAIGCESCTPCGACESHERCCDLFPYGPTCIDPDQECPTL